MNLKPLWCFIGTDSHVAWASSYLPWLLHCEHSASFCVIFIIHQESEEIFFCGTMAPMGIRLSPLGVAVFCLLGVGVIYHLYAGVLSSRFAAFRWGFYFLTIHTTPVTVTLCTGTSCRHFYKLPVTDRQRWAKVCMKGVLLHFKGSSS